MRSAVVRVVVAAMLAFVGFYASQVVSSPELRFRAARAIGLDVQSPPLAALCFETPSKPECLKWTSDNVIPSIWDWMIFWTCSAGIFLLAGAIAARGSSIKPTRAAIAGA